MDRLSQESTILLHNFLWGGKTDKIKRYGMRQGYAMGGLEMADVKSFVSTLKISWLRRILCDSGKITKILQVMCPLI